MDELHLNTEEAMEAAAPAAAEAAPEEAAPAEQAAPVESMDSYAGELNASMRTIKVGDLVEGTIVGVTDSEITVDLQYFAEGIIRPQDYSGEPGFSIKENVHPGDPVTAVVLRMDDGQGNILLSRKAAAETIAFQNFKKMMEDKVMTEMKVVESVKGGVVGYLEGIRAFVPASKLALGYVEDLDSYIGKVIPVSVIQAEQEGKKLVLSCRDALVAQREAEKARRISNLEVGLVTEGTVASLQTYGAFVNLGDGIDGLVHVSQITNTKRVKHPKDVLSVGDKVKVKVTAVKDGKISLSMKALEERPETAARPVEEEKVVIPKAEKLTTSLGDLLKGIKLD